VEGTIRKVMDYNDGPVLVEFVVTKEDNVYPMIPTGQTVHEMLDTPEPVSSVPSGDANGEVIEEVMTLEKG
jgi:hypothetical protein